MTIEQAAAKLNELGYEAVIVELEHEDPEVETASYIVVNGFGCTDNHLNEADWDEFIENHDERVEAIEQQERGRDV